MWRHNWKYGMKPLQGNRRTDEWPHWLPLTPYKCHLVSIPSKVDVKPERLTRTLLVKALPCLLLLSVNKLLLSTEACGLLKALRHVCVPMLMCQDVHWFLVQYDQESEQNLQFVVVLIPIAKQYVKKSRKFTSFRYVVLHSTGNQSPKYNRWIRQTFHQSLWF